MKELFVTADIGKDRLDRWLTRELISLSRSKIQSLIFHGQVWVNSVAVTDPNHRIKSRDKICYDDFQVMEKPDLAPNADVPFLILYEDDHLLVVDKPAGVTVHPGAGNHSHTLVNGLICHCGESLSTGTGEFRPGIIHRIDKDTSGILVVAKTDFSHQKLAKQFASHSIERKYICFCHSLLQPLCGKIETLIARNRDNRIKMAVSRDYGRNAVTFYRTLATFAGYASKVECELKTGRTHQIRVHLAHRGCSLIGDSLYRTKNYSIPKDVAAYLKNFPRQALHAYSLEFSHPCSGDIMHFKSDFPDDMRELERVLGSSTSP